MSVQIQFDGETMDEVIAQARALVAAFGGGPLTVTNNETPPTNTAPVSAPATRTRRTKAEMEAERAAAAAAAAAGTAEKTEPKAPPADAEPDKALVKAKDDALALARDLFASGAPGQDQCRRVAKDFEVKKLGDVPVERANELLSAIQEAKSAANMATAGAGESII